MVLSWGLFNGLKVNFLCSFSAQAFVANCIFKIPCLSTRWVQSLYIGHEESRCREKNLEEKKSGEEPGFEPGNWVGSAIATSVLCRPHPRSQLTAVRLRLANWVWYGARTFFFFSRKTSSSWSRCCCCWGSIKVMVPTMPSPTEMCPRTLVSEDFWPSSTTSKWLDS